MQLEGFAEPVQDVLQIYGLKFEYRIPHRSFLDAGSADDVQKFRAPAELGKEFADAGITSQWFVDGCVVILNDSRKVSLSVPSGLQLTNRMRRSSGLPASAWSRCTNTTGSSRGFACPPRTIFGWFVAADIDTAMIGPCKPRGRCATTIATVPSA